VNVQDAPPRFQPVPRYCGMEVEGCLGCLICVKRKSCIYQIFGKRVFDPSQVVDTVDNLCVSCLRCVQECKKQILSRAPNPGFEQMGDDYWTPDVIASIWKQAESGRIPVSGSGYRGPFTGPGFDQMWTDMSEIVRPTRDGIHGREYISTVIELGRKPARLDLDDQGRMRSDLPPFREIAIPIILDLPNFGMMSEPVRKGFARAAAGLETLAVATGPEAAGILADCCQNLIVKFDPKRDRIEQLKGVSIMELDFGRDVLKQAAALKQKAPGVIVSIRVPLDEHAADRALKLVSQGAEIIHLQADPQGRGLGKRKSRFITGLMREVHLRLVGACVRDCATLLISGGIALAEHVPKILICGADGVGVDLALLAALECRLCSECAEPCPVDIKNAPQDWAAQRIINLIGAWHSQLIEVMGAMGLREARRLRGEMGRAMFFDDLERENFGPLFGERITGPGDAGKQCVAPAESGNPGWDMAAKEVAGCRPADVPAVKTLKQPRSFPPVAGQVKPCDSRYRNQLGKYKVVRASACAACGKCAQVCAYGVHRMGGKRMLAPRSHLCVGPEFCGSRNAFCQDLCPEHALRVGLDPLWRTFGDPRWTADLIAATWLQAETGYPPMNGIEYRTGDSGGGFDRMDFIFPKRPPAPSLRPQEIDLSIPLNRRQDGRAQVSIGFPVYGGGMSFGSISLVTMLCRARAYQAFNSFTCTGEGGYPDELKEYDDHVITQVATGLFGVSEETIQAARIVEFKYAQGAKPGLGGHLLGDKVTPVVAKIREAIEGNSLFSPFPFHSVYSVEDHKKHVDWIKAVNPHALVSVKVSTPSDVDMVAVGSYYAGAHIIHLDGSYGGTGAAPDIAKKNIAMPIEYAISKVHKFLLAEGVRDQMTLIVSGGIRSAWDAAKAIALGADGVVIGTAELVALECIRCANCESGRGCPRGIATTDPELGVAYDEKWGSQRLINLFHSWCVQFQDILWRLGMKSVRELVGRNDLITHRDYVRKSIPARPSGKKEGAR